jgi:transposase
MNRTLKKIVHDNPKLKGMALHSAFKAAQPPGTPEVSLKTLQRSLKRSNFGLGKCLNKAFISPRNAIKRLEFATAYKSAASGFWNRVIWSDETTIRTNPMKQQLEIWVHKGSRNRFPPVNPQIQGSGVSVMFWGCFSKMGLGPLVVVENTMDSDQYISIMQDYLVPELRIAEEHLRAQITFMQDNAPYHKSKKVIEYFERENINLLDWPPQSPDLNPIENLWAIFKRRIRVKYSKIPTSKSELIDQVFAVWDEITAELLDTLAESVSERLALCIRADGYHTKY